MMNKKKSQNKEIPKIVITRIPGFRQFYFQWLLAGLYMLEDNGEIEWCYRGKNIFRILSTKISSQFICAGLYVIEEKLLNRERDGIDWYLEGYIDYKGVRKSFYIDADDAPYVFDSDALDRVDYYFKMQCPIEIKPEGFPLSPDLTVPYLDRKDKPLLPSQVGKCVSEKYLCTNLSQNLHKIKPALIGVRRISISNSKHALLSSYQKMCRPMDGKKVQKAMCYFSTSSCPKIIDGRSIELKPHTSSEALVTSYYKDRITCPNIKRGRVAKIMQSLGSEYDSRIIRDGEVNNENLVIPLRHFSKHVAKFAYNVNISGLQLSIPNRFMDSFMVGTAIFTDKLQIRWYLPFDTEEVRETVPVGYIPEEHVDWESYTDDLKSLPPTNPAKILELYHKKWAPNIFAQYVVTTVIGSDEWRKHD